MFPRLVGRPENEDHEDLGVVWNRPCTKGNGGSPRDSFVRLSDPPPLYLEKDLTKSVRPLLFSFSSGFS